MKRRSRAWFAAACVIGAGLAGVWAPVGRGVEGAYVQGRYDVWVEHLPHLDEAWRWVAEATRDEPATIAFSGHNVPYPLMGTHLSNRVLFVSRNRRRHASYYGWGSEYGNPRRPAERGAWLANMVSYGADYLAVSVLYEQERWPYEVYWAEELPDQFKLVYSNDLSRVYATDWAR